MWEKGVEILQNNQDLFNLKNMKRVKDHLHTSTKLRSKEKSDFNVEDDSDDNMFAFKELLETNMQNEKNSEPDIDILTTSLIKEKGKDKPGCQEQNLVQFPVDKSILFQNEDIDCSQYLQPNLENEFQDISRESPLHVEDTIISMIIDTSWYLDMGDDLQETI